MPNNKTLFVRRMLSDAGGEITGRVRLQKIAFFMREAGFLDNIDLSFTYYHYGPYSEDLAEAVECARAAEKVKEEIKLTAWGTEYSVYSLLDKECAGQIEQEKAFVRAAKRCRAVLLELSATALYLYKYEKFGQNGKPNAWAETERRKKFKASNGRLREAFEVYRELRALPNLQALPEIPFMF